MMFNQQKSCFIVSKLLVLAVAAGSIGLCVMASAGQSVAKTKLDALSERGELLGWEAVGRLELPGGSYCTGTLIASTVVLTAAHCLFDRETGFAIPAKHITFRAGYRNGTSIADRIALQWVVPTAYMPAGEGLNNRQMVGSDMALLELDRPISAEDAKPFKLHKEIPAAITVSVVSYGEGRDEVPSRQGRCAITKRFRGGVLRLNCDVTFGSSGAPVFARVNGVPRIVSVISSLGDAESPGEARPAFGMVLPKKAAQLFSVIQEYAAPLPDSDEIQNAQVAGSGGIDAGEQNSGL